MRKDHANVTQRRFGAAAIYGVAAGSILLAAWAANAQPVTPPPTPGPGMRVLLPGDRCVRRTDTKRGIIKRDACGRWYCGLSDVADIAEIEPDLAGKTGCSWRLEGNRCLCRRAAPPKRG